MFRRALSSTKLVRYYKSDCLYHAANQPVFRPFFAAAVVGGIFTEVVRQDLRDVYAEMARLREDLRDVYAEVVGLREEVVGLREEVKALRAQTENGTSQD